MKMTKKKAAIFGLAAVTLFGTAGFGSCGIQEEVPDVYGPPVEMNVTNNEPVAVYGPPEDMLDVRENETPDVYGPPVSEKPEVGNNDPDPVYGPPKDEKPKVEENEIVGVYGPPAE